MAEVIYVSPDNKTCVVAIKDVFDREHKGDATGHYFQVLDLENSADIPTSRRLSLEEQHAYINACDLDAPYTPAPKMALKFQHGNPAQYGHNGPTNEHVIAATIFRLEQGQKVMFSEHNEVALRGLRMALVALTARHTEVHGK